ncbi:SWF or SNF family helicase, partial [Streptomyces halstedii]|nr:SWF or SNF family helicase [Streptomyces halstedii]
WEDGDAPRLRPSHNRWTVVGAGTQLRYGRDGRWWPYRKERGRWVPAGPAGEDPAGVLAGVSTAADGEA